MLTEAKFLTEDELRPTQVLLNNQRNRASVTKTEYRDSILLRLILSTLARGVEILKLTPASLGSGAVTIKAAKGSNDRTVPLPKPFMRELKDYCKDIPRDQRIFPITTRQLRRIWDKYRTNDQKGAHAIRHTGALKFYTKNRDIKALQYLLGHKRLKSTEIYLDYVENAQRIKSCMKGMWSQKL